MGFSSLWGGGCGHSFNFHFLKMTDLSFVRVCTFYPALSYKSHLSHCIPCVFSGHSSWMCVSSVCVCVFLSSPFLLFPSLYSVDNQLPASFKLLWSSWSHVGASLLTIPIACSPSQIPPYLLDTPENMFLEAGVKLSG